MTLRRAAHLLLWVALALACNDDDDTNVAATTDPPSPLSPASELSMVERESLAYMREEEKLARDVYIALSGLAPQFANVITSEERHMDAALTLLERYGLPDPAAGRETGEFQDGEIQAAYDRFVAAGSMSTDAALRVGVEIEELDIYDFQQVLPQLSHLDIRTTYENLASASANHLRAFYSGLTARGGTYQPQYLSQSELDAILAGDWEPNVAR